MKTVEDIRDALSAARRTAGLSKSELARRLEISRQHVTNIESDREDARVPSADLLLRWVEVCGLELDVRPQQDARFTRLGGAWQELKAEDRELLVRFAELLASDDLPAVARRSLAGAVDLWAEVKPDELKQVDRGGVR